MPESPFNLPPISLEQVASISLGGVVLWAAFMGLIYIYHWHRYGAGMKRALAADVIFFVGLVILVGLAATLKTLI